MVDLSQCALGTDISVWQDEDSTPQMVNFDTMAAKGARFVGIKASQDTWIDEDFLLNWKHAEGKLLRMAYHFYDWRFHDAVAQAKFFSGLLKPDPGEIYPALDFEMAQGVPAEKANSALAAKVFMQEVEQLTGKTCMMYTSLGYWGSHGLPDDPYFASRPLWIAHYGVASTEVPLPWKDWLFWQWTSTGDGVAFGCESQTIDLDYFAGTDAELWAKFGGSQTQPPFHHLYLPLIRSN